MPNTPGNGPDANHETQAIAVLGSGGFIGTYLTLNLLRMGDRLHLLSHKTNPDFVSPGGQIRTFHGSIEDEESLVRCFTGCDLVYHLVGIIAETRTKTFQKTVAGGTAKVVSAAQSAGVKKIIYLSALGTTSDAESLYFKSKWQAEQHIITSGLRYTIFRPSIVYGKEDKFINKIADMVRRLPVLPVIGGGHFRLQPVYVEELCAVMAVAGRKDFTIGKTYEVGGPEPLTYMEILDIIQRVLGRRRIRVHIPMAMIRSAAAILELVMKPAPLTRDMLKMMVAGSTCDQTVVEKEFGVKFSRLEAQLQGYLRSK
jgi:uncharacterized protein YbjT (DUF2867 family)